MLILYVLYRTVFDTDKVADIASHHVDDKPANDKHDVLQDGELHKWHRRQRAANDVIGLIEREPALPWRNTPLPLEKALDAVAG